MNKTDKMNRRNFIKAFGTGIGMAAASSLLPSMAFGSGAGTGRPQRFVVYHVPHGWPIEQVDTFGAGSNWLTGNLILGSLAPWQDKVTVLRGVSRTKGGGGHVNVNLQTGNGNNIDSIDTVVAKALNDRPWVQSIASPSSQYFCRLNYENNSFSQDIPMPLDFVEQAFKMSNNGPDIMRAQRYRSQMMAMNEQNLDQMANKLRGISREENRLSRHVEALREIKARVDSGTASIDAGDVSSLKTRLASTRNLDGNNQINITPLLDGHLDALATGLISGAVKVSTIRSYQTGGQPIGTFPGGPNVAGNMHMNSHNGNADHRIAHYGKHLRWYIDRLAAFVKQLDTPDPLDPAHTVLENTTILYTSEMCDGSHTAHARNISTAGGSRFTYYPMVLIGGGGGALRTGGVIETPNSHFDVYQTLAKAHGGETQEGKIIHNVLS